MKFGRVDHPELIDFTLPQDHPDTLRVLGGVTDQGRAELRIGCAKWNRQELRNFYPRGTRNELEYYSSQFNAIELNATFYRIFPLEQYRTWNRQSAPGFRFFPKVVQQVSHLRRLNDMAYPALENYLESTVNFGEKLGTIFLQMHPNFGPKNWDRVERFVMNWPSEFRLAVEFRHPDWFADETIAGELFELLEAHRMANIITDTAGRRDLLHMRLTNDEAFVRFVGANHPSDYQRLNDWVERLDGWRHAGLKYLHFFIHQNMEQESPMLAAHFIERLNSRWDTGLKIPQTLNQ